MSDLDALTALHARRVKQIRGRLIHFATNLWGSLPDYRDEAIEQMAKTLVPRVLAGQAQITDLTESYLTVYAREQGWDVSKHARTGKIVYPRGVDPIEVYQRTGSEVYKALHSGAGLSEATSRGMTRLESLIGTDMQLAKTHAAKRQFQDLGAPYYRRVLVGDKNCALCMIASTQRYYRDDLLPIHPGCDCSVAPLPRSFKNTQVIDDGLLERIHDLVDTETGLSNRSATGYRDMIVVHNHGEYGPTLTWRGQHFKGPA